MDIKDLVKKVISTPFLTESIIDTKHLLNIDKNSKRKELKKQFLIDCMKELKIVKLPRLIFTKDKTKTETLGHNNLNENVIVVYTKGRLMADALRTVAHELKHSYQDQNGLITVNSGNTGSEIENEANAFAGVMLRNFGKKHPEIFTLSFDEDDLKEDYEILKTQDETERDEDDLKTKINGGNIDKYKQLLKPIVTITEGQDNMPHKYGCLMLEVSLKNWTNILDLVDDNDVNVEAGGKEDKPHVTVLYGFTGDIDYNKIMQVVKETTGNHEFYIELNKLSLFENEGFDVLKFDVDSSMLHELNKICKETFPNKESYPDYKPHVTVAYLNKGEGSKYIKKIKPYKIIGNKFKMSFPNGDKKYFQLT